MSLSALAVFHIIHFTVKGLPSCDFFLVPLMKEGTHTSTIRKGRTYRVTRTFNHDGISEWILQRAHGGFIRLPLKAAADLHFAWHPLCKGNCQMWITKKLPNELLTYKNKFFILPFSSFPSPPLQSLSLYVSSFLF